MKNVSTLASVFGIGLVLLGGCSVKEPGTEVGVASADGSLTGTVTIDGSSTVFPISQAAAEEFQKLESGVNVVVGSHGTTGGFSSLVSNEADIADASRTIKQSEIDACKASNLEYIELTIAIDGLSVMVNPLNDWCDCLTVEQLKAIWEPGSKVTNWSDVNPDWPEQPIRLYGPDTASGTFDYFTKAINGEEGASRADYTPSADDNVLVRGVAGDRYSLAYFGYAYYLENQDKLKVLGITSAADGAECVFPTKETIESGAYAPLARPLFLYVNVASLKKPEVAKFLNYYLEHGQTLVGEVGYIRLSETMVNDAKVLLKDAITKATGGQ